ncbi:hypothetical protein V6246_03775 [Algibacter sp. TI.3.09]|uniref:hypothetical protein n=1 Tax=Algibacter sp. TI.3.09 TaxID=3121298 RepID=UPI00311D37B2
MKKHFLLLLLFLNFSSTVFSQIKSSEDIIKKYDEYFELERETIFTHFNKSRFFEGEEIWFKTYIYNNNYQIPFESTTNIYVSIFNESGNIIASKLLYASKGYANGNFLIEEKFTPGIYFVKTSTNWMKNFKEDLSHVQMIEIIGDRQEDNVNLVSESKYDLQFLPEGGHIVEDVNNTIGFKLLNNKGNGVAIKEGTVFDENKNIITTFKSNQFGLGKFSLNAKASTNYSVSISLATSEIITRPIGIIEKKGVSFKAAVTNNDNVIIALETNNFTIRDLIGKSYYLLVHRGGQIIKLKIDFVENQLKYFLRLKKPELLPGINILTLVNENYKPVAERLVFNNLKTPIKEIMVEGIENQKDSSTVKLRTNINTEINPSFSVSVLPASNESYNSQSTIMTSFLLTPYINGNIENPYYYFSNNDHKTLYDLDLLLLNQGWSRYNWDDIFKAPLSVNYVFETGFVIKGSLNSYKQKAGDLIVLSSSENQIHESGIIENSTFTFENLFFADDTSINFSLKNKNGKFTKPFVYANIFPKSINDNLQNLSAYKKSISEIQQIDETGNNLNLNFKLTELLDTIVFKVRHKDEIPKNKPLISMHGAKYINLVEFDFQNEPIVSIIRKNGFDVVTTFDNVFIKTRRIVPGNSVPSVYIDNMPLFDDFKTLLNLRVLDLEDMYISRMPNPGDSPAGTIKIFTRNGQGLSTLGDDYQTIDNLFGFSIPKEYYQPNYINTTSNTFLKFGAIHWIPNLTPNDEGELTFKVPNYGSDNVKIYIEGMSAEGYLWSKVESINLKK